MSGRAVLAVVAAVLAVILARVHVVIEPPGVTFSALAAVTVAGYLVAAVAAVALVRKARGWPA